MAQKSIKTVIGPVRFSYLHVFEPYAFTEGDKQKYSAVLLLPKSDKTLVAQVEKAIQECYNASVNEVWGGKKPPMKNVTCLQDGDEPKSDGESRGEAYAGTFFLNSKSDHQPGIVDKERKPILNSEEFYSGCWGFASIAFSAYSNNGNMGISCYINNIMKTKDGEPLGAVRTSAADDFAGIDVEDDDL